MDIYTDELRSKQIHDYNPGNGGSPGNATGLFWTIPADGTVSHIGGGATLHLDKIAVIDAFKLFSLPVVPATLSVTATWSGMGSRASLRETSQGSTFVFDGISDTVSIEWSASSQVSLTDTTPFSFATSGSTTTTFARLGHERNGTFV